LRIINRISFKVDKKENNKNGILKKCPLLKSNEKCSTDSLAPGISKLDIIQVVAIYIE
jgi:hypothetical protein